MVSVIIPAYNEEKYVLEALDSIFEDNSDFTDFEVIFVDDASADRTRELVRACYGANRQLRFLNGEGLGVSHARNMALDVAQGRYIMFCDADDRLAKGALKAAVDRAEETNADLVIGRMKNFNTFGYSTAKAADTLAATKDGEISSDHPLLYRTMMITGKLYRRNMIESRHIRFLPISYSEDAAFYMDCVFAAEKIVGCDHILYEYRKRTFLEQRSVTQQLRPTLWDDFDRSNRYVEARIRENIPADELPEYLDGFYVRVCENIVRAFWRNYWVLSVETRDKIEERLADYQSRMTKESYRRAAFPKKEYIYFGLDHLFAMRPYRVKKEESMLCYGVAVLILERMSQAGLTFTLESLYRQDFPSFCVIMEHPERDLPEKFRAMENIYAVGDRVTADFVLPLKEPMGMISSGLSNMLRGLLDVPGAGIIIANTRDKEGKSVRYRVRNRLRRYLPACIRRQRWLPFLRDSVCGYADSLWRTEAYQNYIVEGRLPAGKILQSRQAVFVDYGDRFRRKEDVVWNIVTQKSAPLCRYTMQKNI